MRLLIVTPEFPPHAGGGIGRYYELLSAALAVGGVEVTVIVASPFSAHDDYTTPLGVKVRFVRLDRVEALAERLSHLAATPMLRRWMAAGRAAAEFVREGDDEFDAIETADFGLLFAPILALTDRPPVNITLHGSIGQIAEHEPVEPGMELDAALTSLAEAVMLPAADRLQALSPSNAREWSERLGRDVAVMAPPFVSPAATPQATRFSGLVAGRIQSWKGPELLCRAIEAMGSQLPADLCIAWAGRDTATAPDRSSMSRWLAHEYPDVWGTHIVPIGQQQGGDLASLMASVRYVIAPSSWDTFNYTVAEGMAASRMVIASTYAGSSFLIEPGVNGYSCDATSDEELAAGILTAHSAAEAEQRRMGAAARATVDAALDPNVIAASMRDALTHLRTGSTTPVNALVRRFFTGTSTSDDSTAFLETVGIRELAAHLGHRLARRVRS